MPAGRYIQTYIYGQRISTSANKQFTFFAAAGQIFEIFLPQNIGFWFLSVIMEIHPLLPQPMQKNKPSWNVTTLQSTVQIDEHAGPGPASQADVRANAV